MRGKVARSLLVLIAAVVVVGAVGALVYYVGMNYQGTPGRGFFGPMRGFGHMGGGYGGAWLDPFGLLIAFVFAFLVVWLIVAFISGPSSRPNANVGSGVDGLRELSELHDKGALTDEEFAAAKRKLLGL